MNYQLKDMFAIRIITAECKNESVFITNEILECENKNNECIFNESKFFSSISYNMIAEENIFMPICNDNHCVFCVCSFNLEDEHINKLKENLYEIIKMYIDSQIEIEEEKHKLSSQIIDKWTLTKEKLKNDTL